MYVVIFLQVIEYRGARTLSDLKKFVESGGKDHGVDSEEEVDDEMLDSLEDSDFQAVEVPDEEVPTEEVAEEPATGKPQ